MPMQKRVKRGASELMRCLPKYQRFITITPSRACLPHIERRFWPSSKRGKKGEGNKGHEYEYEYEGWALYDLKVNAGYL